MVNKVVESGFDPRSGHVPEAARAAVENELINLPGTTKSRAPGKTNRQTTKSRSKDSRPDLDPPPGKVAERGFDPRTFGL